MSRRSSLLSVFLVLCACCVGLCCLPAQAQKNPDFNGDGKSDILWRNLSTGDVVVWLMNGTTILGGSVVYPAVPPEWEIVGTGDFNGDSKSDILWRNLSTGDVVVWLMNGTSILGNGTLVYQGVPLSWQVVGTGDFNGDGKADILWRNSNGDVVVWLMNGTTILDSEYVYRGLPLTWQVVGTGDFNGDGKSDILWRNSNGDVLVWLMNGTSILGGNGSLVYPAVSSEWQIAGVGDFNGDGKSDILWRNSKGDVLVWLMNGATILGGGGSLVYPSVSSDWQIVGTGDFNGDGKSDILWRNSKGDVLVWLMNGATILGGGGSLIYSGVSLNWQVVPPPFRVYNQVLGASFGPYVLPGQDPNIGTQIGAGQLRFLLNNTAQYCHWIRTFGTGNGLLHVGAVAHSLGMQTVIGAYLSGNQAADDQEIANLIAAANNHEADIVAVGNEILLNHDRYGGSIDEATLLARIAYVKSKVPANVQVTTVDTWDILMAHPNVINAVDIVLANFYPFYENVTIGQALAKLQSDYATLRAAVAPTKSLWIAETGWPASGNPVSYSPNAIPSPQNQARYFNDVVGWALNTSGPNRINLFWFEAFDEPWKANGGTDYSSWGFLSGTTFLPKFDVSSVLGY